jgi:hypothetical protein
LLVFHHRKMIDHADDEFVPLNIQEINATTTPCKQYTRCCSSLLLQIIWQVVATISLGIALIYEPLLLIDIYLKVLLYGLSLVIAISIPLFNANEKMISIDENWKQSCWPHLIHFITLILSLSLFGCGVTVICLGDYSPFISSFTIVTTCLFFGHCFQKTISNGTIRY